MLWAYYHSFQANLVRKTAEEYQEYNLSGVQSIRSTKYQEYKANLVRKTAEEYQEYKANLVREEINGYYP
ncbi:MAG: hypothetical protein DRR19_10720 [Candidatus Parabeggiatoa sp. nov. 1]|nr:MAG: hypothetical protein DRR19_10720 [Gammaproteobacteria bacterium]